VLYGVAMVAVIVGVDFAFFKNRFWERLTVNIGIVLVFAAFYLRFLRHPCSRARPEQACAELLAPSDETIQVTESAVLLRD
jgi:hypothetical protein